MEGSLVAYKVFTNGSVLNASEINDNLMNQSVMVFSNSTARSAALTSPVEGMLTWLEDANRYENYNGSAWVPLGGKVVQVVSEVKTNVFSSSVAGGGTSGAAMSATITPTSASNKVLIMVSASLGSSGALTTSLTVFRDGSALSEITGDAAGSRRRVSTSSYADVSGRAAGNASVVYLDSPGTTSATTYDIRLGHSSTSTQTVFLNRTAADDGLSADFRQASTITLMEVSA